MVTTRSRQGQGQGRTQQVQANGTRGQTVTQGGDLREHLSRSRGDLREQLSRQNSRAPSEQRQDPEVNGVRAGEVPLPPPPPPVAPERPGFYETIHRMADLCERELLLREREAPPRARAQPVRPGQPERSAASRRSPVQAGSGSPRRSVFDRLRQDVPGEGNPNARDVPREVAPGEPRNRRERRYDEVQRRIEERSAQESSGESPVERGQRPSEVEALARQIQNLQDQVNGRTDNARAFLRACPFSQEIMAYRTPLKFKLPENLTYDGTGDPKEHLISFQARMQIHGAEDPLMCKAFLTTLVGSAQRWCMKLPEHSVGSFAQLAELFITNYAANLRPKKNFMYLSGIKQDPNESLRSFLARWQKEVQAVDDLDDNTMVILFIENLRLGKLYTNLHTDWPTSYAQAIQRANRHADAEEAIKQKRIQEGGSSRPKRPRAEEARPGRFDRSRLGRQEVGRNLERSGVPPFRPPPVAVQEVQAQPPPPAPQNAGQIVGTGKYCRLHRSTTHSTEECDFLKKEIEAIIQRSTPSQWRQGLPWQRGNPSQSGEGNRDKGKQPASGEEEDKWKGKNVINMIVGGPEGGDSAGSRKAWARQLYVGAIYGRAEQVKKACREPITFTDDDLPLGEGPHRDALVIAMDIVGTVVRRVLVDTGSSVNVLYLDTFDKLGLDRDILRPVMTPLAGFTGDSIEAEGSIKLLVELGTYPQVTTAEMEFVVVRLECSHNAILGRPGLEDLGALISLKHLCMKFRTPTGVGVVRSDQKVARDCYLKSCRKMGRSDLRIHTITKKEDMAERTLERPEPAVELEEVEIDPANPERRARIGKGLPEAVKESVVQVLRRYKKIFAWGPEDMPGVDRSIITHRLAIDPAYRPVVQRKRHLSTDRREFVKKEIDALLAAGHIREVKYPKWLANVVLVPKPPAWRMCVDYTDLNKACPKDPFPLPRIDQMVDETAGCALLSFMDAFRGYHQIFMHAPDEEKTAFVTPDGVYCYRVMPFGLKNSGATYTRMVSQLFKDLLGKSMAAYVDDMLVKSLKEESHASDLAASFRVMEKYNLRLNAKKCAFAVQGGKFLGYLVTRRGIEPNPEKVRAVLDMQPPKTIKELQRLTGRLAALSRFLSKSADRSLPFFDALKTKDGFVWSEECQTAFEGLKKYLLSPPLLSKPVEGEVLFLYLAASQQAVSSVLVREEDKIQHPIYYVSRVLKAAEVRYSPLEKMVYALVVTARKLVPYFQAHPIRVLTDQPLAGVLRNPTSSGRLVKWAVELTQYGIEYQPRPAIKAQVLADFIVECTAQDSKDDSVIIPDSDEWWELHADGASSQKHHGGRVMLTTQKDSDYTTPWSISSKPPTMKPSTRLSLVGSE